MNPLEFEQLLFERPLDEIVHDHVFNGPLHIAQADAAVEQILRAHLSRELPVQPENIAVVGSAKMGFSLSPDAFPRPFSPVSDVDVVVIDDKLFDEIWLAVLRWHYPRKGTHLYGVDLGWMLDRRRGIYWGALRPDELKYRGVSLPSSLVFIRDIATMWFTAFKSLSRATAFSGRETKGLLYRSWDHATLYHTDGLARIKNRLENARKGQSA